MAEHRDIQTELNHRAGTLQPNADELGALSNFAALCPRCGAYASFMPGQKMNATAKFEPDIRANRLIIQLKCSACGGGALVGSGYDAQNRVRLVLLWPRLERPSRAPKDLPHEIRRDYDEARAVLFLSPRASAVLTRRCLQHLIREKLEITKRTLFDEIEEALARPELGKATAEALDHVRQIGNWGAHPIKDATDAVIEVEQEEAVFALDVVEMLFEDLYYQPARLEEMKARLSQKEAGQPKS